MSANFANLSQYDLIAKVRPMAEKIPFVNSVVSQFDSGRSLSDRQTYALVSILEKSESRDNQKNNGTAVDISNIERLFDIAKSKGIKQPKFRAMGLMISTAPESGVNAGALYVKGEEYYGKIKNGKFFAVANTPPSVLETINAIAVNPLEQAVAYGRKTGNCSICARRLDNKESVERGIGPICAERFFGG